MYTLKLLFMDGQSVYQKSREEILAVGKKYRFPQDKLEEFLEPDKVLEVNIPVRLDSKTVIFKGFRAQHNNRLGPLQRRAKIPSPGQ